MTRQLDHFDLREPQIAETGAHAAPLLGGDLARLLRIISGVSIGKYRGTDMDPQLVSAIRGRRMIEFDYGGHHRVAEPHVYGRMRGVDQVLVYQVAGSSSSGGLPQWRRVDVHGMSGLTIRTDVFPGPRPNPSGEHSVWDEYYAVVS